MTAMSWDGMVRGKRERIKPASGESTTSRSSAGLGMGQLTLVEHALCPLDARTSLRENLRHEADYRYTDADGVPQTARAVVFCPAGLSPGDEFYLWGLLALTFAQPDPRAEFQATPHFCLRKLGLISADSKGGKSYRLFRDALRRLSAVRYQNERFYDPIRREHRAVSFGLLSYSLPIGSDSSRAWRIVWDPLLFEFCQAAASQLRFDLEMYRSLDHASRPLFLLLEQSMDNIQHASSGKRTPPDWFWELRRREQRRHAEHARQIRHRRLPSAAKTEASAVLLAYRVLDLDRSPDQLAAELTVHFLADGQTEADALRNAQRFTEETLRVQRQRRTK